MCVHVLRCVCSYPYDADVIAHCMLASLTCGVNRLCWHLQICMTATDALGDVCRAVNGALVKYSDEYVRIILNNMMVRGSM